jgi:hypothetical protein
MALFCRAERTSQCPKLGGERTQRGHAARAESDPGCVKTLEAFVGAQQKNRTCGLSESSCAGGILFAFIFCPNDQQNGFHAAQTHLGHAWWLFCCDA